MAECETEAVAAIRRFNRFHTRWIGALGGNLHGSGFALTEARVLYELAERGDCLAVELSRDLDLDPAYLSRILKRFEAQGWLERQRSDLDGRAFRLRLTAAGLAAFRPLDQASRQQAEALLARLSPAERGRLVGALRDTEALFAGRSAARPRPSIREHRAGDCAGPAGSRLHHDIILLDADDDRLCLVRAVEELCAGLDLDIVGLRPYPRRLGARSPGPNVELPAMPGAAQDLAAACIAVLTRFGAGFDQTRRPAKAEIASLMGAAAEQAEIRSIEVEDHDLPAVDLCDEALSGWECGGRCDDMPRHLRRARRAPWRCPETRLAVRPRRA